jgi:hypothetical protein
MAGLIVAVGLTLAASSFADQGLPAEGHVVPAVHLETGLSPVTLPSAAPGSALAPKPTSGGSGQKDSRRSGDPGTPSPTASPSAPGGSSSRYSDDHGNPGSDD